MADCAHERQGKRAPSPAFEFDFFRYRSYLVGSYDNSSEHPTRFRGNIRCPFTMWYFNEEVG